MLFYDLLNPSTKDWPGWQLLQMLFIFIFNELQLMPEWDLPYTDIISFSVSLMKEWGVQQNYWVNIIIYLLKHVSATSLAVLSACGILRSKVQSVARYFVHGCSVPVPRSLRVKPWSPLTICCCHWGGTITFAVPCSPVSQRLGCNLLCNCPETYGHPLQVTHNYMM